MRIKVRYFGVIAEEAGVSEETLSLEEVGSSAEELRDYCMKKYGWSEGDLVQLAINQQLTESGDLKDGDEVAFLPPFAGG